MSLTMKTAGQCVDGLRENPDVKRVTITRASRGSGKGTWGEVLPMKPKTLLWRGKRKGVRLNREGEGKNKRA